MTDTLEEGPKDIPPKPRKPAAKRTRKRAAPRRSPASGPSAAQLREQIELIYQLGGAMAIARDHPVVGTALQANAANCADAWDQVLAAYPKLREIMEKMTAAGGIAALVVAHMPIIQALQIELADVRARNLAAQAA